MFVPRGENDKTYGTTYHEARDVPIMHLFCTRDLRSIDPAHYSLGQSVPVVTLQKPYQDYFRHMYLPSSVTERYRALLACTITLVHEVAHAYKFWLGRGYREPLWCKREQNPELEWSWENIVIGFTRNPKQKYGDRRYIFRYIISTETEEFTTPSERLEVLERFTGTNRSDQPFTDADIRGRKHIPELHYA
jgi:hypothetical protein